MTSTASQSTTDAQGPTYFLVESRLPSSRSVWKASYLAGLLEYQLEAIKAKLEQRDKLARLENPAAANFLSELPKGSAVRLQKYVQSLEPFVQLKHNWDEQGASAPTVYGLWQAVIEGYKLIAVGLPTPKPKVLPDGTLGVYWRRECVYATIDFEVDGVHLWTVTDGQHFRSGTWDAETKIPDIIKIAGKDSAAEVNPDALQRALR